MSQLRMPSEAPPEAPSVSDYTGRVTLAGVAAGRAWGRCSHTSGSMKSRGLWGSDEGGLVSREDSGMVSDMSAASSRAACCCVGQRRRQTHPAGWSQNHGRRLGGSFPKERPRKPFLHASGEPPENPRQPQFSPCLLLLSPTLSLSLSLSHILSRLPRSPRSPSHALSARLVAAAAEPAADRHCTATPRALAIWWRSFDPVGPALTASLRRCESLHAPPSMAPAVWSSVAPPKLSLTWQLWDSPPACSLPVAPLRCDEGQG